MKRKRLLPGVIALAALATLVVVVLEIGPDWAEALVQSVAIIGAFFAWIWRRRPRIALRLIREVYDAIEVTNIGDYTAKDVSVHVSPPWPSKRFGLDGDDYSGGSFGDMAGGQTYQVPIALVSEENPVGHLSKTTIRVSWVSSWKPWRSTATFVLGGDALENSFTGNALSPVGRMASELSDVNSQLQEIAGQMHHIWEALQPPPQGGSWLGDKRCRQCGWDRFWQSAGARRFRCSNCSELFKVSCECQSMWCSHVPAPSQCRRIPAQNDPPILYGGNSTSDEEEPP